MYTLLYYCCTRTTVLTVLDGLDRTGLDWTGLPCNWNMGKVVLYLQAMLRDCTGAPSSHHKAPPSSSLSVPNTVVVNRARLPAHGTRNGDILLRSSFAGCPEQRHAKPCCGSHDRRSFAQLLLLECTIGATMGVDAKAMQAMEDPVDIALTTQLYCLLVYLCDYEYHTDQRAAVTTCRMSCSWDTSCDFLFLLWLLRRIPSLLLFGP